MGLLAKATAVNEKQFVRTSVRPAIWNEAARSAVAIQPEQYGWYTKYNQYNPARPARQNQDSPLKPIAAAVKVGTIAAAFAVTALLFSKPNTREVTQNLEHENLNSRPSTQVEEVVPVPPVPVNERLEGFKQYVAGMSEREKRALVSTVYFEMGKSPSDWAGVLSVITNRAYNRNKTYSNETQPYLAVMSAPHQFSGYKPGEKVPARYYGEVAARVEFHLRDIQEGRFIPMETTGVTFHHANLVERKGKYYIDRTYDHNIYCEDFHQTAADKVKKYRAVSSPYQLDADARYREQKMLLTMQR